MVYLSSIDVIEYKIEFVGCLEGVVQSYQEGMLYILHQNASLCHDVLLLDGERQRQLG